MQRNYFAKLWKEIPERMLSNVNRAVKIAKSKHEAKRKKINYYFKYYVDDEFSTEKLQLICKKLFKDTKYKSAKIYLSQYDIIKFDFERDVYVNLTRNQPNEMRILPVSNDNERNS